MSNQTAGAPPHFLVFVPGYMGSRLRDRKTGEVIWVDLPSLLRRPFQLKESVQRIFDSLVYPNPNIEPAGLLDQVVFVPPLFKQEQYGRMVTALQKMGYRLNPDDPAGAAPALYIFDYDWRQDNRLSAQKLGEAVDRWRARHPGAQPWLMGHSNGGIVSRWYIEKEGGKDHVGRLFLLGSPWDGAPKALEVFNKGLEVTFLRLLNLFDMPAVSRKVIRSFPSFYQLLPYSQPFLRTPAGQPYDLFADPVWLEDDAERAMLADALKFNRDLGQTLSVETYCLFGNRKTTTTGGTVNLLDGGRIGDIQWDRTEAGDGTVPERSAVHPKAKEKLPYLVTHGDIYIHTDVLEKLEFELVRKYKLGTLAEVKTARLYVQFEPEGETFLPGEAIPVWAVVRRPDGLPVRGAEIDVRTLWAGELPGLPGSRPPLDAPTVRLAADRSLQAGRYSGRLLAPVQPGYYRLEAEVRVRGEKPVTLSELVLVEPAQTLEDLQASEGMEAGDDEEIFFTPGYEEAPPEEGGPRRFDEAPPPPPPPLASRPPDIPRMTGAGPVAPVAEAPPVERSDGAPVMSAEAPAADPRYINPEIEGHPADQPLQKGEVYTLAFSVGLEKGAFTPAGQETVLDEASLFPPGVEQVVLDVLVDSDDFEIYSYEIQRLRVPRSGRSKGKARFEIEPKPGTGETGELKVKFLKDNNFVQGIALTLNIGGKDRPAVAAAPTIGRPVFGAVALKPRDVVLLIDPVDQHFRIVMKDLTKSSGTIKMTLPELAQAIAEVRQVLLGIVYLPDPQTGEAAYQTSLDIPAEVHAEALKRLARAGWQLFQRIFYERGDAGAQAIGDRLVRLAEKDTLQIQIVSEQFLLPWGVMYLSKAPPRKPNLDRFLGLRHIVEHIPEHQENAPLTLEIDNRPLLRVDLTLNNDLNTPAYPLVDNQVQYWAGRAGVEVTRGDTVEHLYDVLNRTEDAPQLLYFYCHAFPSEIENLDGAYLRLTGDATVSLEDLKFEAPLSQPLAGAPLVFINACQSTELSPLFYGGFMPYFTRRGARGVIGTECEVPALFAVEWAERFFSEFLKGRRPLGQVFLKLRQDFIERHNNLLGLIYALYCDGDTEVVPGL